MSKEHTPGLFDLPFMEVYAFGHALFEREHDKAEGVLIAYCESDAIAARIVNALQQAKAAPDMLEALEKIKNICEVSQRGELERRQVLVQIRDESREVISKARGRYE